MPLSSEDRHRLLLLGREALRRGLSGAAAPTPGDAGVEITPPLARPAAAFVTLYVDDQLRGCRGCLVARAPLWETVREQTLHSALRDERFRPLAADELPRTRLSISILGEPRPVTSYEHIELGRHGVVLSRGSQRAVFLPSVAPSMGWDLATTLTHLSRKAGLPHDGWRTGCEFEVFEAEVVADPE